MATDFLVNTERFRNFFNELETRKSLITIVTQLHKTLTDHFCSLEQSLSHKFRTLDSQIEAFDAQTKKTLNSLEIRENAIPERGSAAAARIEEQKGAAILAVGNVSGGGDISLLRKYCRRMDAKGLLRFILAKREEASAHTEAGSALREEITVAVLEESVDGMRLVLDLVEEFVEMRVEGKVAVADRRWACGVLIQAVVERGGSDGGVGRSMKEKAVGVLEKWKRVMGRGKNGGFGAGEARMFLQIVVGFGLKEIIGEEYLRKLLVQFATMRHMGKLAVTLGLGDQMKDIIEELAKSRKNAHIVAKNGKYSTAAVEEANKLELNATKAMIKCVHAKKLESKSTIDSLCKRVRQLEKAEEENKHSNKRPQGGGGGRPKTGRFSNASPSFFSHQTAAATFHTPYNYPKLNMFEGPGAPSYGPGYSGAAGPRGGGSYGGPGSYAGSRNFGDYHLGAAYPPHHQ